MTESSPDPVAIARKNRDQILRAFANKPLKVLAEAMGCDIGTAGRIRSGEAKASVEQLSDCLGAAGLKVVPSGAVCVSYQRYAAIAELAKGAMRDDAISHRLIWEDEQ